MPYHIKITQKSFLHNEYNFDLTKQKINKRYLIPLRDEHSILINGKIIPLDDVAQVTIIKTDEKSSHLGLPVSISLDEEPEELIHNRLWKNVCIKGKDLTNELLLKINKSSKSDYWDIIHKKIIQVSMKKFKDGYYADAVESALKEINQCVKNIVKNKRGVELDGADLMFQTFCPKTPVIILGDLSSKTGENIQEGYMHIFAGAMKGIRNPKAHENISIDRERATHFIFLASLLMYKLDEAIIK